MGTRHGSSPARKAWSLLPAQVFLTGLITYVSIATWTAVGGAYTEGLQVVGFAFLSTPITILVFMLGIPFRAASPLRSWWLQRAGWMFVLFALAAGAMVLSYFVGEAGPVHYVETIDWPETEGYEPDARLFFPAFFALAFATMHLRPPSRRRHVGDARDDRL